MAYYDRFDCYTASVAMREARAIGAEVSEEDMSTLDYVLGMRAANERVPGSRAKFNSALLRVQAAVRAKKEEMEDENAEKDKSQP